MKNIRHFDLLIWDNFILLTCIHLKYAWWECPLLMGTHLQSNVSCLLCQGQQTKTTKTKRLVKRRRIIYLSVFQRDICWTLLPEIHVTGSSVIVWLTRDVSINTAKQVLKVTVSQLLTRSCPCRSTSSSTLHAIRESGTAVRCTLTSSSSSAMCVCCMITNLQSNVTTS